MKLLQTLFLCLLVIFSGMPLSAQGAIRLEAYPLPDGRVGEKYQADIEVVLRDTYRLKIETGVSRSILQWALADGELPQGLSVSTDGKIVGTPRSYRSEPYRFQVKVADMSQSNPEPLSVPLSLSVAAPRLRLTSLSSPALVPIENGAGAAAPTLPAPQRVQGEAGQAPQADRAANDSLPLAADVAVPTLPVERRGSGGGFISRVADVIGLGQGNGQQRQTATPRGCATGSVHRLASDEAHNPLEGDTSTQNTCVQFTNLNTLKYRYEFGNKTTRTEGPDLSSLPFLPKLTPTAAAPTTPPASPPPSPGFLAARTAGIRPEDKTKVEADFASDIALLNTNFVSARQNLTETEQQLRDEVERVINENTTKVQNAHAHSKGVANDADQYLQTGDTGGLLKEVDAVLTEVNTAMAAPWPSEAIAEVLGNLDVVTIKLEDLRSLVSQDVWKEWLVANETRYNRVRDRVAELKNKMATINNGATAFNEAKNVLAGWQRILNNVNNQQAAAFQQEAFVSCHTDEGEGKSSKLTISKTDRTTDNATAVTRDVLTVNCYSRVAVTGGFNFSTLDEKEFSVVQAAGETPGSTVKKFGFNSRSSFRPNPLLLLNVRFTDQPVYNWHASFGAVVDLKGQTGTDVEPVAGVSVSIRRIIFITPFALHFGRVNKLAGGFKEGDLVPESIATPPIEKAWKVGYTAGITFRIAPQ
jgi:hypothetical protein